VTKLIGQQTVTTVLLQGNNIMDIFPTDLMDTLLILKHLIHLVIAYILAFPIGWEREKSDR